MPRRGIGRKAGRGWEEKRGEGVTRKFLRSLNTALSCVSSQLPYAQN